MDNIDMRDAFFNGIYKIIENNSNAMIITADHGAFRLSEIERDFPNQFLNVGISEQNAISVAAGLAKSGKVVYVYSINNFITLRSMEHVNIDLCQMDLNVNLIGVGAGFTYATDGPTHHGMQDMQAMRILPNMQVYNVTDAVNSTKLAEMSYYKPGPKYFRIEKGLLPDVYEDCDLQGMSNVISAPGVRSCNTTIISTGYMTHTAIKVSKEFPNTVGVLDVYQIKPFNEELFLEKIHGVGNIIVLEENTRAGGLGELIGYTLAKNNIQCNFKSISINDQHCFDYGDRELLHNRYHLDIDSICRSVKGEIHV